MQANAGKAVTLPLAIMTSGDTHDRTVALLKDNNNFGMAPDQITLMKQEKVASLYSNKVPPPLVDRPLFSLALAWRPSAPRDALLPTPSMSTYLRAGLRLSVSMRVGAHLSGQ